MLFQLFATAILIALAALALAGIYARRRLPAEEARREQLDRAFKAAQKLIDDRAVPPAVAEAAVQFYRHANRGWLSLLVLMAPRRGRGPTEGDFARDLTRLSPAGAKLLLQCVAASTCASALSIPIIGGFVLKRIASQAWAKNPEKAPRAAREQATQVVISVAHTYRHHSHHQWAAAA